MRALRTAAIAGFAALLTLTACVSPAPPPPGVVVRGADPAFLHGTDGSGIDRLAATVVEDVQEYWRTAYPSSFHAAWRDLDGGFFSVDTAGEGGRPPPCSADPREVEGNAYYCATVDAIAWDRAALLPVLREHYGEAAVAVVLAHEFGHAVQQRSGVEVDGEEPARIEAMADCYAGSFIGWVADGRSSRLRIGGGDLDSALRALIVFRDPTGTARSAADAHGTAFDRVAAFQDGFRDGPGRCAGLVSEAARFTAPGERHRPLDEVIGSPGMRSYFGSLVPGRGWEPPRPRARTRGCDAAPVAYCTRPPTIGLDRRWLGEIHRDLGDQASATLIASRYAMASMAAQGRRTSGAAAGGRAVCLAGAYTTSGADGPLSPGDLDGAVDALLAHDFASRDASGANALSGAERFRAFRSGAVGGSAACG